MFELFEKESCSTFRTGVVALDVSSKLLHFEIVAAKFDAAA